MRNRVVMSRKSMVSYVPIPVILAKGMYLGSELVQWVSLDSVDGQSVVSVDGSESSRDCRV